MMKNKKGFIAITTIYAFVVVFLILMMGLFLTWRYQKITLESKYYGKGEFIATDSAEVNNLKNENYVLFVKSSFCSFAVPCDTIFQKVMEEEKVSFLTITIDEYKKTNFYETVKYAPTVIIIEKGKIKAYLNANRDDDLKKYQDSNEFRKWLAKYVKLK